MDTNKTKPIEQETNIETSRWKSAEFRKRVVRKIIDAIVKEAGPAWTYSLPELIKSVERFEEKVNASAKDEAEYIAAISAKLKKIYSLPQIAGSKSSGSGEVTSAQEGEKATNIEWQEQVYQKVQRMKSAYFKKLNVLYQIIISKLQQLESSQEPKKTDLEKLKQNKRVAEYFLSLLSVSKSQITTDFKERLDKAEKSIHSIVHQKNVSSHHQGKESADVQSRQQSVPSHSRVSQMETFEKEPSPQILGTQMCHLTNQTSQENRMCLQEPQVAKQNSNSQQEANQLSIIKGLGNTVQQQTHSAQKATEAFGVSVNTLGISASPMIEDCSNLNEISHKATVISDEPSAAMQRLVKVLTSISPEALSTSVREIKEVVYMNDGPLPEMVQQQYQQNLILQGRKMSRSINAVALDTSRVCASTCDSFNQLTDPEESDLNSVTSLVKRPRIAENCALLEEIREINKLLIDTEIVIGEGSIQSAAGGAAEHGEGLVVKFLFSAVTVNPDLISHYAADKKSIIKPLWLLVPTSYPFSSPVILDQMPLEISEELNDLSMKAISKLRLCIRNLNEPLSLGDIAMSWEHCAREAICENAEANGGGTFSSKYGGWEICQNFG